MSSSEKIKVNKDDKIVVLSIVAADDTQRASLFKELLTSFVVVHTLEEVSPRDYGKIEIFFGSPPKDILKLMTGLRWLQLQSSGVNNYDDPALYLDYDKVFITNSSGVFGVPISEYIIGVMCMMSKFAIFNSLKRSKFYVDKKNNIEIERATVLVVGLGDIGLHVAKACKGLSCKKVIGINTRGVCNDAIVDETYKIGDLINVAPQADYIISALPDNENTRGVFNKAVFEAMKSTSILINVGRGDTVVQEDLAYAMKHKLISAAVLDVTTPDPLPEGHPLRKCPRVFLTGHQSAFSQFNKLRANELYISQIQKYLSGEPLKNIKNLDR